MKEAAKGEAGSGHKASSEWVVLKFGGTSVSSLERWQTIAETLRQRLAHGQRVVVVCSALSQVSNRLEDLLEQAEAGADVAPALAELWGVHERLAGAMGLDAGEHLGGLHEELKNLLTGLGLTGEATPRLRARVMTAGELMSTRLGAAWLQAQGFQVSWQDARELLEAEVDEHAAALPERQYLSATCPYEDDPELQRRLDGLGTDVVVTQGFMARLPGGDTVLLGRGGSDTAASYLAAKLGAEHLEIWTDVPGLFTANPRQVPEARLLRRLGYDETSELAAKGAKVLHPRSIQPASAQEIPIHVRCTPQPHLEGTVIAPLKEEDQARVMAVSARKGLVLLSMELDGDWQPVGLIADIATCFKNHGLSIDLLTSSQTNLVVALDPAANLLDDSVMEPLLLDLKTLCRPQVIAPTASVSLVGTGIREILHEWAPVLQCFEDQEVHMVAQAANDLSLTFVVNETGVDELVARLHEELFSDPSPEGPFGATWEVLRQSRGEGEPTSPPS